MPRNLAGRLSICKRKTSLSLAEEILLILFFPPPPFPSVSCVHLLGLFLPAGFPCTNSLRETSSEDGNYFSSRADRSQRSPLDRKQGVFEKWDSFLLLARDRCDDIAGCRDREPPLSECSFVAFTFLFSKPFHFRSSRWVWVNIESHISANIEESAYTASWRKENTTTGLHFFGSGEMDTFGAQCLSVNDILDFAAGLF